MKKILILTFALCATTMFVKAADVPSATTQSPQQVQARQNRGSMFEKRLGLTEEQKIKAREIRIKGHENLEPVIDQIVAKKQEARMIKMSRMAVQMQEEKLAIIDDELKILEKKANEIRRANMREFESILTKQQKRILKDMKKEGRQRYHSEHPHHRQPVHH